MKIFYDLRPYSGKIEENFRITSMEESKYTETASKWELTHYLKLFHLIYV